MSDTVLGAMVLVATLRTEDKRGVDVSVEVRLDPHLREMMTALSDGEKAELLMLRRDVARAATSFFVFLRDPDDADAPVD